MMPKSELKKMVREMGGAAGTFSSRKSLIRQLEASPAPAAPTVTVSSDGAFGPAVSAFPGALQNSELIKLVTATLDDAGYDSDKTLCATSFCCDEVNRPLESDLRNSFTNNFVMGGLAGFPFGGATSFGAMAAHIPDGGSCLLAFGPHVGVDSTGKIGTVERRGRANGGSCCGSAVAASGYVAGVLSGEAKKADIPDDALHAQQAFVGDMLLPHAERLEEADDKMQELPYALYDAQKEFIGKIVEQKSSAVADGNIAVLGGIQINTPAGFSDYYLPLSFELYSNKGELLEDFMDDKPFSKVHEIFPGALTNKELVAKITKTLKANGIDKEKTLVATSLCCDEVNRPLEEALSGTFADNFNMGGLAGFPVGGAVAFGAMAAHIPDGGSCVAVYGPHVGVDSKGAVGTVERKGRKAGGSCCGSAVAASGVVSSIFKGEAEAAKIPDVVDAQQYFVNKALQPYAERLEKADEKMVELPYALYDAQTELMTRIVEASASGVSDGLIAVLGGVQINTPAGFTDYYLPLSFNLYDNQAKLVKKFDL
uniref:Limiting CO2-inducible protein B/C beta carbonyic anhydrase domain-containing protein n=1 Tax=Octactis speculum TaxID=3111310 RepID=A0A7S2H0R0_9STRA